MKNTFNFNRPYVRNVGKTFAPLYFPGERYSFYINFSDTPPNDNSPLQVFIINANTNAQVAFIGRPQYVFVAGSSGYHLYIENFVFPIIPDGQYFFQIWNINPSFGGHGAKEQCRSNIIQVDSQCLSYTSYITFRHNDSLFDIRYDLLPSTFYQKFRLPINQVENPEISSTREQYRQSSGQRQLRNSKSFRDIKQTLEFYWANQEDFEAISCMLEHNEVYCNGSKLILLEQIKIQDISPFSEQFKGKFVCIIEDDIKNNGFPTSPDFILRGGTTNYLFKSFYKGS